MRSFLIAVRNRFFSLVLPQPLSDAIQHMVVAEDFLAGLSIENDPEGLTADEIERMKGCSANLKLFLFG